MTLLACLLLYCDFVDSDALNRRLELFWHSPQSAFELLVYDYSERFIRSTVEDFNRCLRSPEVSTLNEGLSDEQQEKIRQAGWRAAHRFVRDAQTELLIAGCYQDRDMGPWRPAEKKNMTEFCLLAKCTLRLQRHTFQLVDEMTRVFKSVASPEQWLAFEKCMFHPKGSPTYYLPRREQYLDILIRRAAGELTEQERVKEKIEDGSRLSVADVINIQMPESGLYNDLGSRGWHYRVAAFVAHYELTEPQQHAARVILEDCQRRARVLREQRREELEQLWRQLVTAYLFPEESKVSVAQATRDFRRKSQEIVRPVYEQMQRRLEGLLTQEQKARTGPPPPKPAWMELMEFVFADEDDPWPLTNPPADDAPDAETNAARPSTDSPGGE